MSEMESVLKATIARIEKEESKAIELGKGIPGVILNNLDKVFDKLGLVEE